MRVKKEKYLLTEIANEFIEQKIGNELTLLECLREGQLKAFIMYPPHDPRPTKIPKDFWEDLDSSNFEVSTFTDLRTTHVKHQQAYLIDSDFAHVDESLMLDTIIDAVIAKDITLMDKHYRKLFEDFYMDDISKKVPETIWKEIAMQYGEWRSDLEMAKEMKAFSVYVSSEDWNNFVIRYLDNENPLRITSKKIGRKETELWNPVYIQIIAHLINNPASSKNLKQLSKDIDMWIKSEHSKLDKNDAPKQETIYQKLLSLRDSN